MNIRIGLLQCDHVANDLQDIHGNYPEIFETLFLSVDPDIEMVVYDLTSDQFPVELTACDGYLITGSQFSVYDDIPWIKKAKKLIKNIDQAKIPTVGICFGHQLIAESLGGKVSKASDKGWGVGVHSWDIQENNNDWMEEDAPQSFALRASHQDQVTTLPPNAKILASSNFCPIAGFQISNHVLSFQGHPEFSKDYTKALMSKRIDRIGEETFQNAVQSLQKDVHSKMVVAWIIKFIHKNTISVTA